MARDSAGDVMSEFNQAINARDLTALMSLMHEDHVFVDSGGSEFVGKPVVAAAWEGFFSAFPRYRNEFERIVVLDDRGVAIGRSICPDEPALDGRAIWEAKVAGGLVTRWQVFQDSLESRSRLGVD